MIRHPMLKNSKSKSLFPKPDKSTFGTSEKKQVSLT